MSVLDALKQAQAHGLPKEVIEALCEACGIEYGAILPPISGTIILNVGHMGVN